MTRRQSLSTLLAVLAISLVAFGLTRYALGAGLGMGLGHGFVHFGHPYAGSCTAQRAVQAADRPASPRSGRCA